MKPKVYGKQKGSPITEKHCFGSPLCNLKSPTEAKMKVAQLSLISWNVTKRCNLHCAHCYLPSPDRLGPSQEELSTREGFRLIDEIAAVNPGIMLIFSGGEPLLRPDLLELVENASQSC